MAKEYKCPYADIEWTGITCKKTGNPCGNVRWCNLKGRTILTEMAENCPKRSEDNESDNRKAEKQNKSDVSESSNNRVSDKRRK